MAERQTSLARSRSWTDKTEYKRLSGELGNAEGTELAGRVRNLLSVLWPETVITVLDDGVLLAEGAGSQPCRRVVVCVGYPRGSYDLGAKEAREVCESIGQFQAGDLEADTYLLIHNRDSRSAPFRETVQARLAALEASRRVRQAQLWDRQRLLKEAFDAMLRHLLDTVPRRSRATSLATAPELSLAPVPLRKEFLAIDQYQLKTTLQESSQIADPADLLLETGDENLSLLVGEFGSGKTTAVERSLRASALRPIYVPGAVISGRVVSAKDFLHQFIRHDDLFSELPGDQRRDSELLARPALEYILKDPELPVLLIVDGLDESAFLTRRGGFQHLFNLLWNVRVPVVLTLRSELWHRCQSDFAAAFGKQSRKAPRHRSRIRLIELLPWTRRQTTELIERYRQQVGTSEGRTRLDALADLAAAGRLGELYSDLPERPLFLQLILESVVERGLPIQRVGRARLLRDWASFKVHRDVHEPFRAGGEGRVPLLSDAESSETTVELAWEAMLGAAAAMVQEYEGVLELTEDCELESVRSSHPRLEELQEPLGLFLNSLLLPAPHPPGTPPRVRFAHRSFQEFFLAWASLTCLDVRRDQLPPSVVTWVHEIEEEGLLERPGDGERLLAVPVRPTPREEAPLTNLPAPHPDLEIRVEVKTEKGVTRLTFDLVSAEGKAGFRRRRIRGEEFRGSPQDYHARLHATIESLHKGVGADGEPVLSGEATAVLEALGRELYDELFPSGLRDAYRTFRKEVETLVVVSDEPWIPWELVKPYDDSDRSDVVNDDFLCEKFQLTRWLAGETQPVVDMELERLACFEGTSPEGDRQLEHAAREREWLEAFARRHSLIDRSPTNATLANVKASLKEGGLGLVHLVGHGEHDTNPNESRFYLADGSALRPRDLYGPIQTRLKESRPLIFLNACQVGRQGWSLTGLGGWAARCVGGCGCGAFVAPQWTVGDQLAHAFATTFYKALEDGASFGRAAREARRSLRQLEPARPSWLAYAVYAHPEGRLHFASDKDTSRENGR